jgi:hypothetical protein
MRLLHYHNNLFHGEFGDYRVRSDYKSFANRLNPKYLYQAEFSAFGIVSEGRNLYLFEATRNRKTYSYEHFVYLANNITEIIDKIRKTAFADEDTFCIDEYAIFLMAAYTDFKLISKSDLLIELYFCAAKRAKETPGINEVTLRGFDYEGVYCSIADGKLTFTYANKNYSDLDSALIDQRVNNLAYT